MTNILRHRKCFHTEVSSVANHFYSRLEVKDVLINVFLWYIKTFIDKQQNLAPFETIV